MINMNKAKKIKELQEELDWLENTPFYIGDDGMPSIPVVIIILLTGIIWGIIGILVYRHFRKKYLRKKIIELKKQKR